MFQLGSRPRKLLSLRTHRLRRASQSNRNPFGYGLSKWVHLLLSVLLTNATLDSGTSSDAVDPLEQVGKRLHFLGGEASAFPALYPAPSLDISNAVFALSLAGQVVAGFAASVDTG